MFSKGNGVIPIGIGITNESIIRAFVIQQFPSSHRRDTRAVDSRKNPWISVGCRRVLSQDECVGVDE